MSVTITCPACATVSHFDEVSRDAASFCRNCDYPLFWTRSAQLATVGAPDGAGLRRLPGAGGKATIAMLDCPVCTEQNMVTATVCVRCGADLHPAPVVEPEPEPEPDPEPVVAVEPPPPAPEPWWPWAVFAASLAVALLVALLALG